MRVLTTWTRNVLAILAVASGATAGCNLIVDAGGYSVVAADASSAGEAGASGVPDASASDGASGDADLSTDGRDAQSAQPDASGRLGDPCSSDSQCTAGTCGGSWCTQACSTNAICGVNSAGRPNDCVQEANGEFVCVPSCAADSDCQRFGGATCQPIVGVAESVCTSPAIDGGGTGAMAIAVGDPCSTKDAPCGQGADKCNGFWCVAACTGPGDTSCGDNTLGVPNHCATNQNNESVCFPGCTTNTDCTPLPGMTCQPAGSSTTDFICAATAGNIGDPCSTASTSPWTACSKGSCDNTWCNTTCASTTDTGCGANTAGVSNQCVQNSKNTFSCFPGCKTADDCAPFASAFCQPISGGGAFVCAVSGGQVGDPCTTSSDCTESGTTCAGSWCSKSCASTSDTCGTDSAGLTNFCVQDSTTLNFSCFPGCSTSADCTPYAGASCVSTGTGSQTVCSF